MNVRDIIKQCLVRLRLLSVEDIADTDYAKLPETNRLLMLLSYVITDIVCNYLPCNITEEIVLSCEGDYDIGGLSKSCHKIKSLKIDGKNIKFTISGDNIVTDVVGGANAIISYSYIPLGDDTTIDSIIDLPTSVSDNMVVCGMLTEYCMTDMRVDEALIYDTKYRDYLRNAMTTYKVSGVVRARRW